MDLHDTYNESWCAAPAAVSRPAKLSAARSNEVVTLVVTRQLPAKDYAAMDAGRVTQVGGAATSVVPRVCSACGVCTKYKYTRNYTCIYKRNYIVQL